LTVGAIVKLEVFDCPIGRIKVYLQLVIESLARIFDVKAKVRNVVIEDITTILHCIRALDWTTDGYPSRRRFCLNATDVD
jgi:hypothetical protein